MSEIATADLVRAAPPAEDAPWRGRIALASIIVGGLLVLIYFATVITGPGGTETHPGPEWMSPRLVNPRTIELTFHGGESVEHPAPCGSVYSVTTHETPESVTISLSTKTMQANVNCTGEGYIHTRRVTLGEPLGDRRLYDSAVGPEFERHIDR